MNYTTYFANINNLPDNVVAISIARWSPKWWRRQEYKKLAPSAELLTRYKKNGDELEYIREYNKQLDKLDPHEVYVELLELSGGMPFALVCYEGKGKFCHRILVANWLRSHGIDIKEW